MLKQKIVTNTFFNIISQLVTFGFSVILARLLFPNDFGLYSISYLTIDFAVCLTLALFSVAVMQLKEARDEHFSAIFWINFVLSLLMGAGIFLFKKKLADFFNMPLLVMLLSVHVFAVPLNAFVNVFRTKLFTELRFKEIGIIELIAKCVTGLVATLCAWSGLGVISLVIADIAERITRALLGAFILKEVLKKLIGPFRWKTFQELMHVGWGMFLQNLLLFFTGNIDYVLIGKLCNAYQLGFYQRAFRLMTLPVTQISCNISQVLLPAFAKIQDDVEIIRIKLLYLNNLTALIGWPFFTFFYLYADQLIVVLFGSRWLGTIAPLKVLIIAGAIQMMVIYVGDTLKAKGVVYREFFFQILQSLIMLFGGLFFIPKFGIQGMAWVVVLSMSTFWLLMVALLTRVLEMKTSSYFLSMAGAAVVTTVLVFLNFGLKALLSKAPPIQILCIGSLGYFLGWVIILILFKKKLQIEREVDTCLETVNRMLAKRKAF